MLYDDRLVNSWDYSHGGQTRFLEPVGHVDFASSGCELSGARYPRDNRAVEPVQHVLATQNDSLRRTSHALNWTVIAILGEADRA